MTAPLNGPCPKCGFCAAAVVTVSWSFTLDQRVHSLNAHRGNYAATRWTYKRDRDAWCWRFKTERINQHIPSAIALRRVTLTRLYSGRERELDAGNFVGGCKVVLDAMVREGLLVDDAPAYLEDHYNQQRAAASGLAVLIEELG